MDARLSLESEMTRLFSCVLGIGFRQVEHWKPQANDEAFAATVFLRERTEIEMISVDLHGLYSPGFRIEIAQIAIDDLPEATCGRASSVGELTMNSLEYDYRYQVRTDSGKEWFRVSPWMRIFGTRRATVTIVNEAIIIIERQIVPWFDGVRPQLNIEQDT